MTACAYFITAHGFGHAARAAAVMAAIHVRRPETHFHLFTQTPAWFFAEALGGPFTVHAVQTDIGLAQTTPMQADLAETVRRLEAFLPLEAGLVRRLAAQVQALGCRMVLCDIAALGIAVAEAAGRPAVLIENFTWDWIYAGYLDAAPGLCAPAQTLRALYDRAPFHVQTEPVCAPGGRAALVTAPVARTPRETRDAVRARLGVPAGAPLILLTMGGFEPSYGFLDRLREAHDTWFVIPGGSRHWERRDNLVLLPHHSPIYHPDLVQASDAVVGKLGYSTLAEVYHAGAPYGFIRRPGFRESAVLARYVAAQMPALEIQAAEFENGDWLARVPDLLALPRHAPRRPNGADQIASFVSGL